MEYACGCHYESEREIGLVSARNKRDVIGRQPESRNECIPTKYL